MPRQPGQKAKLLHLLQILWQETDPDHRLSVPQLLERLQARGIHAERKSIYDDLKTLEEEFGFDILQPARGRQSAALAGRSFELPELSMLVDMVQSSRFLTAEKAAQLTEKLAGQASCYQAEQLRRQIWRTGAAAKAENQHIYYTLDQLNTAMLHNRQVSFLYLDWTLEGRVHRHGGRRYLASPWALIFQDDNYYLVAFDAQAGRIKHFRIDRIDKAREEDAPRTGQQAFENAHPASYADRMFGMYGGREERVALHCPAGLLNAVRDRFGAGALLFPDADRQGFTAQVLVAVSPQFFGWLAGLGSGVQVVSPPAVKEEYCAHLRAALAAQEASR